MNTAGKIATVTAAIVIALFLSALLEPDNGLERVDYFKDDTRNRVQIWCAPKDPGAEVVRSRLERQTATDGASFMAAVYLGDCPENTFLGIDEHWQARALTPEGWAYRLQRAPSGAVQFAVEG